jgi:hypothetical protein
MNLKERADLIDALSSALDSSGHSLDIVPKLLRRILEEGAWREFETKLHKQVRHERFEQFVITPPLEGLGASVELIRRMVADDPVALDLLDQALQGMHGGDRKSEEVKEEIKGLIQSLDTDTDKKDTRDRSGELIRRLRKDFPELHTKVLNRELSIHRAAVEAGIFPRRYVVNLGSAHSAAELVSRASPEFLEELRKLLNH